MQAEIQQDIANFYGWDAMSIEPIATGLINHTWKVSTGNKAYIVQQINNHVFRQPEYIDANLQKINRYLKQHAPGYLFTAPLTGVDGHSLYNIGNDFYRAFDYIPATHTLNVVHTPEQAFEAANQFGQFTAVLSGFDTRQLHPTIPDFHNLVVRYQQFQEALKHADAQRRAKCMAEIKEIQNEVNTVKHYGQLVQLQQLKTRVTHHDTKISNVLFNKQEKAICVIDLDTVMPGYFLSDVGDMIRAYTCPVSEDEKDPNKIQVRKEFLQAIKEGYFNCMKDELTNIEKTQFYFAGEAMIYMQALRFMTDYLMNNRYYKASYESHNLVRTRNQLRLLREFRQTIAS